MRFFYFLLQSKNYEDVDEKKTHKVFTALTRKIGNSGVQEASSEHGVRLRAGVIKLGGLYVAHGPGETVRTNALVGYIHITATADIYSHRQTLVNTISHNDTYHTKIDQITRRTSNKKLSDKGTYQGT